MLTALKIGSRRRHVRRLRWSLANYRGPGLVMQERSLPLQLWRYCENGILSTSLTAIVIFVSMVLVGLSALTANVLGYSVGIIASYFLNRTRTFSSNGPWLQTLYRFLILNGLAYCVNLMVLLSTTSGLGTNQCIAQILAMLS